jgi:hypothetical protein
MGRHVRKRNVMSTWEARKMLPVGTRVQLIHCGDRHTRLKPGRLGSIAYVDDRGTPHINWDEVRDEDGNVVEPAIKLGLVIDAGDQFKVIS